MRKGSGSSLGFVEPLDTASIRVDGHNLPFFVMVFHLQMNRIGYCVQDYESWTFEYAVVGGCAGDYYERNFHGSFLCPILEGGA